MKLLEVLASLAPEQDACDAAKSWLASDARRVEPTTAARLLRLAKLLLYLHARPCRTYSGRALAAKLGFVCTRELQQLAQLGLVVQSEQQPPTFGYGVEDAELLRAVEQLFLHYHAFAALTGFVASLSRHHRRAVDAHSRALRVHVAKPKQRCGQEARNDERATVQRRRRGPTRISLGLALVARDA